jgi:hypothetical protein
MMGGDDQAGGQSSVGERNLRSGSGPQRCRDAGHDFEGDPCCSQRFHLFTSAAKDERVTALQAHHHAPAVGVGRKQSIDFVLRDAWLAASLPDM